jgi:proton-translocating NAD(P)+ transhydrogenase subunit alpha
MNVFIPKERPGENRVAATPETVKKMIKIGLAVTVEAGAGDGAHFADTAYREAGAEVAADAATAWSAADLVLKVAPPTPEEARQLKAGAVLVGFLAPDRNLDAVRTLADRKASALAMELIPRVTRAQAMDALSSQASIAGYKAVLLGAARLGRYFPLLMTAAGTIPPSRVVIMGAGVAGLMAIATAKRLGAVVEVSDIRAAVKEQVQSLGGKFIELPTLEEGESGEGEGGYAREMTPEFLAKQREIVTRHVAAADVVITTALVPGKPAPKLVTQAMVEAMRPGSVIVDLAVEQGGNCELSRAGEEVIHQGVVILGPADLPSQTPLDASTLYARNVLALLHEIVHDGALEIDLDNEIVDGALLTHGGEIRHAPTAEKLQEVAR